MKWLIGVLISSSLLSCSTYSDSDLNQFDNKIKAHIDSTGANYQSLDNGLYVNILDKGESDNPIRLTDVVTFYYTGEFLNGDVFQEINKDEALTYPVRQLIVGWQDAMMFIGEGGEIDVIIPPHLGYGPKNTELIPPNTIIKYRLKVLEVK